jgi:hypothetical protein
MGRPILSIGSVPWTNGIFRAHDKMEGERIKINTFKNRKI